MPKLRFVHAADLHLDSPFRGVRSEAPNHIADTLYNATFAAYENIVELCLNEKVDALLVAGDVYDAADRSLRAQLKFVEGLKRLDDAGVRSFICHGNHDPLDGWEARLNFPAGCVRFGPEVTGEPVFLNEPERAMVYGVSYPRRGIRENLVPRFSGTPSGDGFNIGLLHANVGGDPNHDSYAPCSVADLESVNGIDYWALGHVHSRKVLRQELPIVVYPGNPQARHSSEPGTRGVYLVEVDDSGAAQLEFLPVDVVRWETLSLDIRGLDTEQAIIDAANNRAEAVLEASGGHPIVARMVLTGRGPMHRSLRHAGAADAILEQMNDQYANAQPWLWCARIQVDTASPIDREQVAQREDFVGDLARLGSQMRENPDDLAEARELLRELYVNSNASQHLRSYLPLDDELRDLLAAAEDECLAALVDEEDCR